MEVGVNFLVVTIICIMLLGIGIMLMNKFIKIGQDQLKSVNEANQKELIRLMSTGEGTQVALIPSIAYINKGERAIFSLGINNELGSESSFSIAVEPRDIYAVPPDTSILYSADTLTIKNNMNGFLPIVIRMPKNTAKGSYIFNVYVCKIWYCNSGMYMSSDDYKYGEMQHIQINVK